MRANHPYLRGTTVGDYGGMAVLHVCMATLLDSTHLLWKTRDIYCFPTALIQFPFDNQLSCFLGMLKSRDL